MLYKQIYTLNLMNCSRKKVNVWLVFWQTGLSIMFVTNRNQPCDCVTIRVIFSSYRLPFNTLGGGQTRPVNRIQSINFYYLFHSIPNLYFFKPFVCLFPNSFQQVFFLLKSGINSDIFLFLILGGDWCCPCDGGLTHIETQSDFISGITLI